MQAFLSRFWEVLTRSIDKMLFVSSDVTNATTSFADITGLTWPILANKKYTINAWLLHQTNATTTGVFSPRKISINTLKSARTRSCRVGRTWKSSSANSQVRKCARADSSLSK